VLDSRAPDILAVLVGEWDAGIGGVVEVAATSSG